MNDKGNGRLRQTELGEVETVDGAGLLDGLLSRPVGAPRIGEPAQQYDATPDEILAALAERRARLDAEAEAEAEKARKADERREKARVRMARLRAARRARREMERWLATRNATMRRRCNHCGRSVCEHVDASEPGWWYVYETDDGSQYSPGGTKIVGPYQTDIGGYTYRGNDDYAAMHDYAEHGPQDVWPDGMEPDVELTGREW